MKRRFSVMAMALASICVGACEWSQTPEPPPAHSPPSAAAPTDPAMATSAECLNPIENYSVRYPAGWHVGPGDVMGPCSLFDPEPIQVPRNSELPPEIAIVIGFQPVPIATITGDTLGRREITREPTTVDGRAALRVEAVSTGDGLHSAGLRWYEYIVDLGDSTMVATTYDVGSLPLERKRLILDAMMASLDFLQP